MFYVSGGALGKRWFFVVLTSVINNFKLALNLESLVKSSKLKCEEFFGRIPSSWPVNLYLTAKLRFLVTGL